MRSLHGECFTLLRAAASANAAIVKFNYAAAGFQVDDDVFGVDICVARNKVRVDIE